MTTTVLACPKCRLPVRLREGESTVQCTGCGASIARARDGVQPKAPDRQAGEGVRQAVLWVSLLVIAGGLVSLAVIRRHRTVHSASAAPPVPIYAAPPATAVAPTPEGEIAWEADTRAPVLAAINGDAVEDIFGFFRVWDGRSAWVAHAGAFDGATLKPLWRTDPIDPQLVKQPGVVPLAVVAGQQLVVADTSPTLRVLDLATGTKKATLTLSASVMDVCHAPDGPNRVWVRVVDGGDTMYDLSTEKTVLAPRPKWCPEPTYQATIMPTPGKRPTAAELADLARKTSDVAACAHAFGNAVRARSTCRAPSVAKLPDGFSSSYELTDGALTVALGVKDGLPFAESLTKASPWVHSFVTDNTKAREGAPAVADLAFGRVYAVHERVYLDAQLTAFDAATGQTLWLSPLVGSMPAPDGTGRGPARALVATSARVYVARDGGGLEIFDAATGKAIGTIGRQ